MTTVGSITREAAAERFPFLAHKYPGRRGAIKAFTHRDPDFVFWIYPDGRLHNARDSHAKNVPRGYEWIVDDEPEHGGFLRGRVATLFDTQLIVVYCRIAFIEAVGIGSRQTASKYLQELTAEGFLARIDVGREARFLNMIHRGNC